MQTATGWKLSEIQFAFTLFILFQTWVQPLDGWLIDRVGPRWFISAAGLLCGLGWAGLTQRAIATTPENIEDPEAGLKPPQLWREIPAEQLAGIGYFRQSNCKQCHALGKSGAGPDLAQAVSTKSAEWLSSHFTMASSDLAANHFTGQQIKSLTALVSRRDAKGLDAWTHAPDDAIAGANVYQARQCGACWRLE